MSLEDKLRLIWHEAVDVDDAIVQIKQAFQSEGYLDPVQAKYLYENSGQEWCDKFVKELEKAVDTNRRTQDFTDAILAAKRAAGLDKENT